MGAFPFVLSAADVDKSKLPPAATTHIDFTRDIQPIFENSCLRCHGPEKTKSQFRLDSRPAALKGGEKGVDILVGNSAKSPLIHYVAALVTDMEMPPSGKGDPLMSNQIALLRAWIDQGAVWGTSAPTNNLAFSITPIFGGTTIHGDNHTFRELNWQKEGINGGIEEFQSFEQTSPGTTILLSGHALQDDYKITLDADRADLGFVHTGWQQYRKYYDDTGGFYPALDGPPNLTLGQDVHLDIGKAWVDFGLTLPDWPRMVLGYEYDYKKGGQELTSWGFGSLSQPNIAPVVRQISEELHTIKFDLDHEMFGVTVEERFRGEFYRLNTQRSAGDAVTFVTENENEGTTYFQGMNTLRLERKFSDWFFSSAGYLYSKLDSDNTFSDSFSGFPLSVVPQINLEKESHIFNINGLFGPFDGLTVSSGVQSEWTRQQGLGGGPMLSPFTQIPSSDYDQSSITENLALRYTKIAYTVLFAEARLQQQRIGENENNLTPGGPQFGDYLQDTDYTSQLSDLRVGFSTSPWQSVSFSAHYRRYDDDTHYNTDLNYLPIDGYPGFLRDRDVLTDEVEAKLVMRPSSWLKTTLSYQYLTTDYRNNTDPVSGGISPGGSIQSGETDSKIYSINLVLTPWRRLYLSGTFSYQPSTTITFENGVTSVAPYDGHTYSVLGNATFVLNNQTDIFANYSMSQSDFAQNNFAAGLPLGLEYQQNSIQVGLTRRFTKTASGRLLYSFNSYNDPSNGGALNFEAHTIFAAFTFKLR